MVMEEPYSTTKHFNEHHTRLLAQEMKARRRAGVQNYRSVKYMSLQPGDRVIVRAPDLASKEGNKLVPSWLGTYFMDREHSRVSYILRSEIGDVSARCIRTISDESRSRS